MHQSRRERILASQGGVCGYPGCTATKGLEIDHRIALELGGKEADENLWALCGPHHAQKTKLDAKLIAKARRIRKTEAGETRSKKPIQSRGFGDMSRGFDGKLKPKKNRLRPK
jgi:5-methylcytosine-specific restriction endonuclease McrA